MKRLVLFIFMAPAGMNGFAQNGPCTSGIRDARPKPCFYCGEGWSLRRAEPGKIKN